MIWTYKHKKADPPYSKDTLETAVASVRNGELTIYRAAKAFNVPKSTLFKQVKDKKESKAKHRADHVLFYMKSSILH